MEVQAKRKAAAKAPISAHPAFPAIAALWFAALLGLGSLVLPVQLFERASAATGLASVVAAAQAPLGVTARILIAAAAAGIGATLGLALGARIAATGIAHKHAAKPRVSAKRPISAHEELGDAEFADFAFLTSDTDPGCQPAPSVDDESAPGDVLETAPLHAPAEPDPVAFEPESVVTEELAAEGFGDSYDLAVVDGKGKPAADEPSWQHAAPPVSHPLPHPEPTSEEESLRDQTAPSIEQQGAPGSGTETIAALVARFARALEAHRGTVSSEDAPIAAQALPAALKPAGWDIARDDTAYFADEEDEIEGGYSSLLAMKSTPGIPREAVRIEVGISDEDCTPEPVVTFPGHATREVASLAAPAAPATRETERALREALEKLQRLSGAA